jgi:hypothetical protein
MKTHKKVLIATSAVGVLFGTSACAGTAAFGQELSQAFNGVSATWTTYDQYGRKIDEAHGTSFRVSRDERFDSTDVNSDGTVSTVPGEVLLVSVGKSHISHVGSSACLAQDGIVKVGDAATFDFNSTKPGTPFINDLREKFQNLWHGKSKTIAIRSQNGLPIAVYAGNNVEVFPTDVPKSTWFRIDGKWLWCYRVDETWVDNDLLDGQG